MSRTIFLLALALVITQARDCKHVKQGINHKRCGKTGNTGHGKFPSVKACADKCAADEKCNYFSYWTNKEKGECEFCDKVPASRTVAAFGYHTDVYKMQCSPEEVEYTKHKHSYCGNKNPKDKMKKKKGETVKQLIKRCKKKCNNMKNKCVAIRITKSNDCNWEDKCKPKFTKGADSTIFMKKKKCCKALTAECMACKEDQTVKEYCKDEANCEVAGCGGCDTVTELPTCDRGLVTFNCKCNGTTKCDPKHRKYCWSNGSCNGKPEPQPCDKKNGGCSAHATCTNVTPKKAECACKEGFIGDGKKCTEIPAESDYECATGKKGVKMMKWIKGCRNKNKASCEVTLKSECELKCDSDKRCLGYDFRVGAGKQSCRLYSTDETANAPKGDSRVFCSIPEPIETDYECSEENTGMGGQMMRWIKGCRHKNKAQCDVSFEDCEDKCEDDTRCLGFDFKKDAGKTTCRLFNKKDGQAAAGSGRTFCSKPDPPNPCDSENGGCAPHAVCSSDGKKVECKCEAGFIGDGKKCEIEEPNSWECSPGSQKRHMMKSVDGCTAKGCKSENLKACEEKCTNTPKCVAIDFRAGEGQAECRLFSNQEPKYNKNVMYWCPRNSGEKTGNCVQGAGRVNAFEKNVPGCGRGGCKIGEIEECMAKCDSFDWCQGIDHVKTNCRLYKNQQPRIQKKPVRVWCGNPNLWEEPEGWHCSYGAGKKRGVMDVEGKAQHFSISNKAECQLKCSATPECQGIDFQMNQGVNSCRLFDNNEPRLQPKTNVWCKTPDNGKAWKCQAGLGRVNGFIRNVEDCHPKNCGHITTLKECQEKCEKTENCKGGIDFGPGLCRLYPTNEPRLPKVEPRMWCVNPDPIDHVAETDYECTEGHIGTAGKIMRWIRGCRHKNKAQCKVENQEDCEVKCEGDVRCSGFDFKKGAGKFACRLFSVSDVGEEADGRTFCARPVASEYLCTEGAAGTPGAMMRWIQGCRHKNSAQCDAIQSVCEAKCESHPSCKGYDIHPGQGKKSCRLYKSESANHGAEQGRSFCAKPRELKPEEKWQCLEGKHGKPVAPKMDGCSHKKTAQCNASEDACQLACEANAECQAFDYAPKKGKSSCRLFAVQNRLDSENRKWCPKDQNIFVNACETNHGGCSEHATCESTYGKSKCTCKEGYVGDGFNCEKPNPCLENHGGCHADAFCTNDDGTAKCECNEGFEGNGKTCTLIHACDDGSHGCQHLCEKNGDEFFCKCHDGYKLKSDNRNCKKDDPCETENGGCSAHASCANNNGMAVCSCDEGYEGDGKSCTQINPCEQENYGGCDKENASCENNNGVAICSCLPGFEGNGQVCDKINPCENNGPCGANFLCRVQFGEAGCFCKEGLVYNKDTEDCDPKNPCETDNGGCSTEALCTNNFGVAECACAEGFEGDGFTCKKIDPCTVNHGGCNENASCTNLNDNAICECLEGFEGNGRECKKIHPCDDGSHGCQHECTKEGAAAKCACHDLYELQGDGKTCEFQDACATEHGGCSENADCVSYDGIASCTCREKYHGDGKVCEKINPCLTNNGGCAAEASCTNNDGHADCQCNEGYEGNGRVCTKIDPCSVENGGCHADAICKSDGDKVESCTCKEGLCGDGIEKCESEDACMNAAHNPYKLVAENSYMTGYSCGHEVNGDWKLGECTSSDSMMYLCKTTSSKDDNCAKMDIFTTKDCHDEVEKQIIAGVCHPNGWFQTTLCNAKSSRSSCVCQHAGGKLKGTSTSTVGNDVFQTASGQLWEEADPCDPSPCHADATCKVYKDEAQCRCNEPLVGDGIEICETEQKCHGDPTNIFKVDAENKRFSGYSCGHSTPGDWSYGACDETKSQFRICRGFSTDPLKSKCLLHDPPIRHQDDCAKVVEQLVKDGICHSSGLFMSTFCAWSGKHACVCMLAGGKVPKYYDDENLNDIFMLNSGIPLREPCEVDHGGCLQEATCTNYKGKAFCQCPVPKVGDGQTHCESEEACMASEGNTYQLVNENKYFSGDKCGHGTPGDWKYGECDATKTKYVLCRAWSTEPHKNSCQLHDPPIKSQDDCAAAVQGLIKGGICHPNGRFFSTGCHGGGKPTCTCQLANGAEPRLWSTSNGYDIFELIPDNPCLSNNGGCHEQATCANVDKKPVCTCNEGLVGDGVETCETVEQCTSGEGNLYNLIQEDKYLSGDRCGHQTPGDWKYGECSEANTKFSICNSYSEKNLCLKADPPIKNQDDCAAAVKTLIGEGTCHANGKFFGTFCHTGEKMSCYCQLAGGTEPRVWSSSIGNDLLQLKDHAAEIEVGKEGFTMYTNYFFPLALCGAAFGMGFYFSNKKNNGYKPLLDKKVEVEMQ